MDSATPTHQQIMSLQQIMERASCGLENVMEVFYQKLLKSELYVPCRFQEFPLTNSPKYPNEFLNILGVQDKERVVIPVFTESEYIADWSGLDFKYEKQAFLALLSRIPESWWVVVNPGQEVEKELSPWELETLKGGESSIPELLEEQEERGTLTLDSVSGEDDLKICLIKFAEQKSEIQKMYLAHEVSLDDDGDSESKSKTEDVQLILGVEVANLIKSQQVKLKQELADTIAPFLIGRFPIKIYISSKEDSISIIGMFQQLVPFFEIKRKSLIERVASTFFSW